jgi:hypothetical protein
MDGVGVKRGGRKGDDLVKISINRKEFIKGREVFYSRVFILI